MTDWSRITSYTELTEVAWRVRGELAPEAFLDGPFRRYLSWPATTPTIRASAPGSWSSAAAR